MPLAARCLVKGARVLDPKGWPFADNDIGAALATRELMDELRQGGAVTDEIVRIDATQEEERKIAQANTPIDENGRLVGEEILCRTQAGQYVTVSADEVDLIRGGVEVVDHVVPDRLREHKKVVPARCGQGVVAQ